jgi:hypothetical protein
MKITIENHHENQDSVREYQGTEEEVKKALLAEYHWLFDADGTNDLKDMLIDINSCQAYSVIGIQPKEFAKAVAQRMEEEPEEDDEGLSNEDPEQPDDFFDQDYLVPEIGNMHAYRNYVAGEPPSGVHIYLTCKAVKDVLEDDGVKSHNDILIAIGSMLNDAAGVPDDSGKVFHVGHDSYYVHMPTYESGLQFLYNLQSLVNDLPTLYSKHPYFDIGMGDDMENAYAALSQLDGFKIPNKTEGNHVMIHTANSTRYISPEDIL